MSENVAAVFPEGRRPLGTIDMTDQGHHVPIRRLAGNSERIDRLLHPSNSHLTMYHTNLYNTLDRNVVFKTMVAARAVNGPSSAGAVHLKGEPVGTRSARVKRFPRHLPIRRLQLCAVLIGALVMSSCSNSPSGGTAKTTKPAALQKITIADTSYGNSMLDLLDTAQKYGFFKRAGFEVTIEPLSSPLALQAVVSGAVTYDDGTGFTADEAVLKGEPVRTYASFLDKVNFVLVGKPGITKLSQLRGTTVAAETSTELDTVLLKALLKKENLLNSVSLTSLGGGVVATASILEAGKVSAGVIDRAQLFKFPPGYNVLYNYASNSSPYYSLENGLVATVKYANTHRTQIRALIAAMIDTMKFYKTHESQILPIIEANAHLSASEAAQIWAETVPRLVTSKPTKRMIDGQLKLDVESGNLAHTPSAAALYNFAYYPKA